MRSLTLLMPPWAQTLCERLTGVRLIRSTATPASASFIAAARPASPPPTTNTRCFAIFALQLDLSQSRLCTVTRTRGSTTAVVFVVAVFSRSAPCGTSAVVAWRRGPRVVHLVFVLFRFRRPRSSFRIMTVFALTDFVELLRGVDRGTHAEERRAATTASSTPKTVQTRRCPPLGRGLVHTPQVMPIVQMPLARWYTHASMPMR